MKNFILGVLLCALIVAIGYIVYENNPRQSHSTSSLNSSSGGSDDSSSHPAPSGAPSDYFPTDVGHSWSYKISVSTDQDALHHEFTIWPLGGNNAEATETRGRYLKINPQPNGVYYLTLHVKGLTQKQGPLQYPEGYELAVDRDDLGIFESTSHVYWAIDRNDRYEAQLVVTQSGSSPGAPQIGGMWGGRYSGEGYSMRLFFFGGQMGDSIGLHNENDSLTYMGPTTYKGKDALTFIREVKVKDIPSHSTDDSILNQPFTEEVTFVRGVGLVRLVQKVGSKVTMTWELLDGPPPSLPPTAVPSKNSA